LPPHIVSLASCTAELCPTTRWPLLWTRLLCCAQQGARLNPEDPAILANLGLARLQAGYVDGAIAAYEESWRLDPEMLSSGTSLATAYDDIGRTNDALVLREQLLARMVAKVQRLGRSAVAINEETDLRRSMAYGCVYAVHESCWEEGWVCERVQ
jgi:hypothetical protein